MISFVCLVFDACHAFVFFFFEAVVEGDEVGEVGMVLGDMDEIFFCSRGFFCSRCLP